MLKNRRNQGFSLIELMFAMIFLTVIVFGVVKLQTSNLALSNTQNSDLQAHFLANQGVEIVEAIGIGGISGCSPNCTKYISLSGGTYTLADNNSNETIQDPYSRTVMIEEISAVPEAYKIMVQILLHLQSRIFSCSW